MFHFLRKPARWASKKNRPPKVFDSKARQGVLQSLILQSWFNKSLDACVLLGDKECQVSEISLGSLLILDRFFPRLVSAFSLFSLVSFVDPTGKNIPFQPYTLSLFIDYP